MKQFLIIVFWFTDTIAMASLEQKQLEHLTAIEKKAEEILVDKNDIVSLDMRRNWDRESIRAVEKLPQRAKVWTSFGACIVKVSRDKAKEMLEKDLMEANIEVNTKRSDMKIKANDLRDLEYEEKYKGFSLTPLSREEMSAMKQVWGERS